MVICFRLYVNLKIEGTEMANQAGCGDAASPSLCMTIKMIVALNVAEQVTFWPCELMSSVQLIPHPKSS